MATLLILAEEFQVIRWTFPTDNTSPPFGEVRVSQRAGAAMTGGWAAETVSMGHAKVTNAIMVKMFSIIFRIMVIYPWFPPVIWTRSSQSDKIIIAFFANFIITHLG
jgi:hypothetical protein